MKNVFFLGWENKIKIAFEIKFYSISIPSLVEWFVLSMPGIRGGCDFIGETNMGSFMGGNALGSPKKN